MQALPVRVSHVLMVELKALEDDKIKEASNFKEKNSTLKKSLDAMEARYKEMESWINEQKSRVSEEEKGDW